MTFENSSDHRHDDPFSGPKLKLRILATTDLHAHVLSWNYDTNQIAPARGLSRVATLVEQARAQVENCLLFDNGDFLNGSGLSEAIWAHAPKMPTHPIVMAMNHLNYDAVAVGNHEFSHGLDFLKTCVSQAVFPILCSNLMIPDFENMQPFVVLTREMIDQSGLRHHIKIGVISLLPMQTLVWEARNLDGIATAVPMLQTAQTLSQHLREMGADIVVALAHTGFAKGSDATHEENLAKSLSEIATIDAVISGHSHSVYPTTQDPLDGVAIVCPGFYGSHLGLIDLELQRDQTGWHCIGRQSAVRPVAHRCGDDGLLVPPVAEHREIVAIAQNTHSEIIRSAEKIVGRTDHRLHRYFALLADSPALNLIASAQLDHLHNTLTDPNLRQIPILAAAAPFKAGGRGGPDNYTDSAVGALRIRNISDLYPHPNYLVEFRITGAELRQWLERSCSLFLQVTLGDKDAPLIAPDFPSFNFEVIFGVTYNINLSQPPRFDALGRQINPSAQRIENLMYQGKCITEDQIFILASNSFRRDGTAGFAGTDSSRVIYESCTQVTTIIQRYLERGTPPPNLIRQRWKFTPMPDTTVIFDTALAAVDVADEISHLTPRALTTLASGFRRFRLHL